MKPTGAARIISGVKFICYRTGIMQSKWMSEDGRLTVQATFNLSGYTASVGGDYIRSPAGSTKAKRFRTLENAMKAAVKADKGDAS